MYCVKICLVFSVLMVVAAVPEDVSVSGKFTHYCHDCSIRSFILQLIEVI